MAICPECKKVIDELEYKKLKIKGLRFFIDTDGYADVDRDEVTENTRRREWGCPKCKGALFYDWDDAEEFLKEKDEFQELVAEKIEKIKDGS